MSITFSFVTVDSIDSIHNSDAFGSLQMNHHISSLSITLS